MNILRAMTTKIVMTGLVLMAGVAICKAEFSFTIIDIATDTDCGVRIKSDGVTIRDLKKKLCVLGNGSPRYFTDQQEPIKVDWQFEYNYSNKTGSKGIPEGLLRVNELLPSEFYFQLRGKGKQEDLNDDTPLQSLYDKYEFVQMELIRGKKVNKCIRLFNWLGNCSSCCNATLTRDQIKKIATQIYAAYLLELNGKPEIVEYLRNQEGVTFLELMKSIMGSKYLKHEFNRNNILRFILSKFGTDNERVKFYTIFMGIFDGKLPEEVVYKDEAKKDK